MSRTGKKDHPANLQGFDFSEAAELYGGGSWSGRPTGITYRRFDSAAEAIQFAVEELAEIPGRGCILEVNEMRFNYIEIRKLYRARGYPLPRKDEADQEDS